MVTITALRTALYQPAAYFLHLQQIECGDVEIVRSTHFAEARVKLGGKDYLLYLPLQEQAMQHIVRFITLQRHALNRIVPRVEILRNEMRYETASGATLYADILLEPLPDALPLTDAIATISDEQEAHKMISSLEALRQALRSADVSHNNIRKENLLIDSRGVIYPIRWFYATDNAGGDDKPLENILNEVAAIVPELNLRASAAPLNPDAWANGLDEYLYCGNPHEGLIAVESEEGWGYVDCNGCEVIKPQYIWANDFCEGRAEVQTPQGMGLIDKQGEYVIDPIYEAVEFDVDLGWVRVCKDNQWTLFDYSGRQLSEWGESNPSDIETKHIREIQ